MIKSGDATNLTNPDLINPPNIFLYRLNIFLHCLYVGIKKPTL